MIDWSVVLIAKDEAGTLPRLMASLQEFQRQGGAVVLVDTGSTDGTAKVAADLGCVVTEVGDRFVTTISKKQAQNINRTFVVGSEESVVAEGDTLFRFADARNFAASLSPTDLVSMPDCDEEYTHLDLEAIARYISDGYEQFEFQFVFAHDQWGNEAVKFKQCKFYDRRKLRWRGIIHEVLEGTAKSVELPENVLKLEHWQNPKSDRKCYLKGLAVDCYQNRSNDRNSHYLGRELVWTGRPRSAIQELWRHIGMNGWPAERAQSMIFVGDAYGQLNQPEEQVVWYSRGFYTDPSRREALIKLARFYQHNKKPMAVAAYAAGATQIPWHPYYANQVSHYRQEPHELLYWARGWMGDIKGAQESCLEALRYQPFNANFLRDTKYYFEYPDQGIEGWMQFEELQWLYETAKGVDTIAELGSWKGRSTHALASGCKWGHVTAIDHFHGSRGEEAVHQEAQTDAVYEQFLENTKQLTNLTVHRADTQEAADSYEDGSFDMVFIDAEHTYEGVRNDIRRWRSKARIMLCGHDYCSQWPGVQQAVDEELGMVDVHGTIWSKLVYEPSVVIVIPTLGRPDKLNRCLRAIKENAEYRNYTVCVMADNPSPDNIGVPSLLNKALEKTDSELVMYLGNDCVPQPGFLRQAVYAMLRHFPLLDGLVGLNDGYWHGEVATHWLAGRALLPDLDHEFFHTGYHHVGCDNELTERARKLNKYYWEERARINHDHPINTGQPVGQADEVYRLGWQNREADLTLLKQRSEKLGFPFRNSFRRPRIPRRIFTIWLGDEASGKIKEYIRTHRLPGYEHKLITLRNCYRNEYVNKCIGKKQWVRAADYLRLYYLYTEGGIYLDADIEVLKSIPEDMLADKLFCGSEENGFLANSVIGAEAGCSVLKDCLDCMDKEFTGSELVFEAGMAVFTEQVYAAAKDKDSGIRIYPPETFFPYNHQTGEVNVTEGTLMWHHFMKSWIEESVA